MKIATTLGKRRLAAGAAAALTIAVGGVLLAHAVWPSDPAAQARKAAEQRASQRVADRGLTDTVTVAVAAGTAARPATERPAKLPAMIRASGPCNDVFNSVRDLMDRYPTGLVLPAKGMDTMNGLLADVNHTCTTDQATKFLQQEVLPWQTWKVPAGYKFPAELIPAPESTSSKRSTAKPDNHPTTSSTTVAATGTKTSSKKAKATHTAAVPDVPPNPAATTR